jgi:hypothetical protein
MKWNFCLGTAAIIFIGIIAASCTPSTPTVSVGVNTAAVTGANGLRLSLTMDAKTYQSGQEIKISVDEMNELSKINDIPVSDNWGMAGLMRMYLGPCGYPNIPVGIAVFPGDIAADDISTVIPLHLYDPSLPFGCTAVMTPTSYSFKPSSDKADVIGDIVAKNQQINYGITLKGFWTTDAVSHFSYFNPGEYTVISGDEWGNVVLIHFSILNAVLSSTPVASLGKLPVKVLSVTNSYSNGQQENPTIAINLQNTSAEPIVALTAVLEELAPVNFPFDFDVTSDNPLNPGQNIIASNYLFQGEFGAGIPYALEITGIMKSGKTFSFKWTPPDN